jgi:hypothetical protein
MRRTSNLISLNRAGRRMAIVKAVIDGAEAGMAKVLLAVDGSDANVRATRRFLQLAKTLRDVA